MGRSCIIQLYKPATYTVDYNHCKQAHDLRSLIEEITDDLDFFDISTGLDFVASVEDESGEVHSVPLDGAQYYPEKELPSLTETFLDVCGSPKREYGIQIHRAGLRDPINNPPTLKIQVNWRDTIYQVKEQIRKATGIATSSQILVFEEIQLLETNRLYEQKILENCMVDVKIKTWITFFFKSVKTSILATQDQPLADVLMKFAEQKELDTDKLRFMIIRPAEGEGSDSACWGPTGDEKWIAAYEIDGTVEENGLEHGAAIYTLPAKPVKRPIAADVSGDSGRKSLKTSEKSTAGGDGPQ